MSESSADAISLSTLPPDLIRKIIPMIDEPFKTGVNLISRSWNEFDYLRYRPIDNIKIVSDSENKYQIEVRIHPKDVNHFGLDEWAECSWSTNITKKVHKMSVGFVEPSQRDDMCCILKSLAKVCSGIKSLWFDKISHTTLERLSNCFGPTQIEEITFCEKNWCRKWKYSMDWNMPVLKEMARKHKTEKVYYNGKIQSL